MDDIEIRLAGEADADDILAMLRSLAEETGDGDRFRCRGGDIRNFGFGERPFFECLVAVRGDRYLGLALYFPLFSTTRGRPGVYLQDLWVAPDCRDVGLGTRLLRRVIERAGSRWQAVYLDLMVHGHNDGADRYYRRHGFEERAEDRHLTLEGDAFRALLLGTD
ncbi:MAG: N-acetyltransferase [Gammaproteobacteria bacterium]|jgi:ribosomal protein S18 acetylase RimI-like enzyme